MIYLIGFGLWSDSSIMKSQDTQRDSYSYNFGAGFSFYFARHYKSNVLQYIRLGEL
jgi:hypothetical protein